MNPPSRLSQDGADEFEASLLRSARSDGASANRDRTLAALAGVAGVAIMGTAASGGVAVIKAKGALAGTVKKLASLKYLAVIGLGLAGGVAGVVAYRHNASPPADEPPALTRPGNAALTATAPPLKEPPELPLPAEQAAAAPPAGVAPRAHAARVTSKHATSDSLLEEVSILDRARQQLLERDGVAARKTADSYLARFPKGRLAGEAKFIRIRAALLTGGHAGAAPLAASFLREHPDSPHAPALRKIMRAAPGAGGP